MMRGKNNYEFKSSSFLMWASILIKITFYGGEFSNSIHGHRYRLVPRVGIDIFMGILRYKQRCLSKIANALLSFCFQALWQITSSNRQTEETIILLQCANS